MQILTIEQVCELLNVKPSWIYARTCDGALRGTGRGKRGKRGAHWQSPIERFERMPHYKCGKLLRFDRDEVLVWFAKMHRHEFGPSVVKPEESLQRIDYKEAILTR